MIKASYSSCVYWELDWMKTLACLAPHFEYNPFSIYLCLNPICCLLHLIMVACTVYFLCIPLFATFKNLHYAYTPAAHTSPFCPSTSFLIYPLLLIENNCCHSYYLLSFSAFTITISTLHSSFSQPVLSLLHSSLWHTNFLLYPLIILYILLPGNQSPQFSYTYFVITNPCFTLIPSVGQNYAI